MIEEMINNVNNNNYDKDEYKKIKQEEKQTAYSLIDEALEKIKSDKDFFKQYLNVQSKFYSYTPRNALLVTMQEPNAIQLKQRSEWKELKAVFRESEPKKIIILEPGEQYTTASGEVKNYINSKVMIDISETNIKPYTRNYDKKMILQALIHDCPADIKVVDNIESGKLCEWDKENNVLYISNSEDVELLLKSVSPEITKAVLFESNNELDADKANCISYMLCQKYGIDMPTSFIDNLQSKYSNMDKQDIANDLTSMKEVLKDINGRMHLYLDEKRQENKKDMVRENER